MSMAPKVIPRIIPLEVLESCPAPCFTVNEALDITYCNPAWNSSASENQGGRGALRDQVLLRNLLDFIPQDLKAYHAGLFAEARSTGQPVNHDYECSSASMFRVYRMQIYPLDRGFAVINSLRLEHPHDRTPLEPNDALYCDSAGLIHMCSNCRRTNRTNDPAAWDWVPDYVEHMRENTTHGVCPACLEYYYRPYMKP